MSLPPDWLSRALGSVDQEIDEWPRWMRDDFLARLRAVRNDQKDQPALMCFPSAPAPAQQAAPAPPAPAPLAESVSPNYNATAENGANPNGPNMLRDPSVQAPGGPGVGGMTGASGLNSM